VPVKPSNLKTGSMSVLTNRFMDPSFNNLQAVSVRRWIRVLAPSFKVFLFSIFFQL
jgi:hypothetical protein